MKTNSMITLRLGVFNRVECRFIKMQKVEKASGVYILPNGQEAYIADSVRRFICPDVYETCRLDGENYDRLLQAIDDAGSEKPMVPVKRVGAGPTEKSASYAVDVIQKIADGSQEGEKNRTSLKFTLPVSQIEDVGEGQLAAPLWLILEKLKQKSTSQWGAKHRQKNSVVSEFVPALLKAKTSTRVRAFKEWLVVQRDELLEEARSKDHEREEQTKLLNKIAVTIFSELGDQKPMGHVVINIVRSKFPGGTVDDERVIRLVQQMYRENRESKNAVSE